MLSSWVLLELSCQVSSLQGDWGTQFGMLIQYMAEKRPEGLNATSDEDVADLQVSLFRVGHDAGLCAGLVEFEVED